MTGHLASPELLTQIDLRNRAEKFEFVDRLITNATQHNDDHCASAQTEHLDHLSPPPR